MDEIKKTEKELSPEEMLKQMKLHLTEAPGTEGNYIPCVRTGNLLFISGQLPRVGPQMAYKGRLGKDINIDNGQRAARQAVANALAIAKKELGLLSKVKKVVRMTGYINSYPGFCEQARVMDGASELLVQVFGVKGKHSRVSVGVTDLPLNACLEIDLILEVS